MADLLSAIGNGAMAMMVFAVFSLVIWTTIKVARGLRRGPSEILQLRLFQEHRKLALALILVGAGVASTFLHVIPYMVGLLPPVEWHNAVNIGSMFLMAVGFVWLARTFSIPTRAA